MHGCAGFGCVHGGSGGGTARFADISFLVDRIGEGMVVEYDGCMGREGGGGYRLTISPAFASFIA